MRRLQAFRFKLIPTGKQLRRMRRIVPVRLQQGTGVAEDALRAWREETGLRRAVLRNSLLGATAQRRLGVADAPVRPLQQTIKDLERACSDFFARRAETPQLKIKGRSDSFRYPIRNRSSSTKTTIAVSAKARLAAGPLQPGRAGHGEERHRKRVLQQMVRIDPG